MRRYYVKRLSIHGRYEYCVLDYLDKDYCRRTGGIGQYEKERAHEICDWLNSKPYLIHTQYLFKIPSRERPTHLRLMDSVGGTA